MNDDGKISVNVIGTGVMGIQVAALMHVVGHDVNLFGRGGDPEKSFHRKVKLLGKYFGTVKPGKLSFYSKIENLPDNLTIECIVENLSLKRELYSLFRSGNTNLFFSNTSSFSPDEIGENVFGLHFYNPIFMKVIELCISDEAINDEMHVLKSSLEQLGFSIIRVRPNRGYIGNYILFNEISTVFKLIEQNEYEPSEIVEMSSFLYGDGTRDIFNIIDIIGIDIVYQILENLKLDDDSLYLPKTIKDAISAEVLGKKNKTSIRDMLIGSGD